MTDLTNINTITAAYTPGNPASEQGLGINGNVNIFGDSLTISSVDKSALAYVTLSGTVTSGDVITLTFNFNSTSYTAAYTAIGGDTLASICAGLGAAIKANANLYVAASSTNPAGGGAPGQITSVASVSNPLILDYDVTHAMTITSTVGGAHTELVAIAITTASDANPVFGLSRNTGVAPAPGSNNGQILFAGTQSSSPASLSVQYASIVATILNSTSGSLAAQLLLGTCNPTTGALDRGLYVGSGAYTVGVTDMGYNTANAGTLYQNGHDIRKVPDLGGKSNPVYSSGTTLSATDFVARIILRGGSVSALTDTTPSATAIIAALPNAEVGSIYSIRLYNYLGGNWTIAPGTGVAFGCVLSGNIIISTNQRLDLYIYVDSVATPHVSIF